MKKLIALLLTCLAGAVPLAASADDSPHTISANVALSTDYVYRGQSQSDENPAISGGFDYSYATGGFADFYAGTWASNISFGGSIETDFYGGLTGALGDTGVNWDGGVLYYLYPGKAKGEDLNFVEGHFGLSYDFSEVAYAPSVGFTVHYSPDWQTSAGDAVYLDGNVSFSLPQDFGLSIHVGDQLVEKNAVWGTPDWVEWNVYLSKTWGPLDFALGYHDTDLSKAECFGGTEICDGRVVFSVSAGF